MEPDILATPRKDSAGAPTWSPSPENLISTSPPHNHAAVESTPADSPAISRPDHGLNGARGKASGISCLLQDPYQSGV